jgi:hypothetical protein
MMRTLLFTMSTLSTLEVIYDNLVLVRMSETFTPFSHSLPGGFSYASRPAANVTCTSPPAADSERSALAAAQMDVLYGWMPTPTTSLASSMHSSGQRAMT